MDVLKMKRKVKRSIAMVTDPFISLVAMAILPLLAIPSRLGWVNFPLCRKVTDRHGCLPVRYHYFQPIYHAGKGKVRTEAPGFASAVGQHKGLLSALEKYAHESASFPIERPDDWSTSPRYYYNNISFLSGDAEILYAMIRHLKPGRIIEVGSGFSTLVMAQAARRNLHEAGMAPEITCVEPYEAPWLSKVPHVKVVRKTVTEISLNLFERLGVGDILFIDSSHVIRPGDDLWFLFFKVLPLLKSGCYVHFHDIFLPRDYPADWIEQHKRFWNEQYMLAAFLAYNDVFEPRLMLNAIYHEDRGALEKVCSHLKKLGSRCGPGSFWIQKVR